jgi:hypothetical protein
LRIARADDRARDSGIAQCPGNGHDPGGITSPVRRNSAQFERLEDEMSDWQAKRIDRYDVAEVACRDSCFNSLKTEGISAFQV